MRGPDWKWGHQDNGKSFGTVTEASKVAGIINSSSSEKWCNVIWDEGGTNIYRVGFKFDLCVARTGGSSNSSIVAFIFYCHSKIIMVHSFVCKQQNSRLEPT